MYIFLTCRCLIYLIAKNYFLKIEISKFILSDIVLQLLILQLSKACLYSTVIVFGLAIKSFLKRNFALGIDTEITVCIQYT